MDEVNLWYEDFKRSYPTGTVTIDEFKKIYRELCDGGDPDEVNLIGTVFRL